jgi:hypothetical protein
MTSAVISRLKKVKQRIIVTDVTGKAYEGVISAWDELMFAVHIDNGDDVFFPINGYAHFTVVGGYEKPQRTVEDDE